MEPRTRILVLALGLVLALLTLGAQLAVSHLPGTSQGYEPAQPIAFSHGLHAGELKIDCQYCHTGAERSRHAGIPAASTCMNCHSFVTAPFGAVRAEDEQAREEGRPPQRVVSSELGKLYDALGLNEQLQRDPAKPTTPIEWLKVHQLPDFVFFDHSVHVNAGVDCQSCHGPVESMERVRQVETLTMGWCVNCHRDVNETGVKGQPVQASLDCAACHY